MDATRGACRHTMTRGPAHEVRQAGEKGFGMTTTAAAVARLIAEAGIDRVFGLPGGEVLVLIGELGKVGVDFVLMRHEANAGLAAAVYGKLRRQPGVVLATLGSGAANLMLPMANAYLDQEPLVAISAQIPEEFPSSHTHQLLPLHDVYRPVTRYVDRITAGNVQEAVNRALDECMRPPFGTAYLTLSAREALKPSNGSGRDAPRNGARPEARSDARAKARQVAQALGKARRPLVLVGLGANPVDAPRLRRLLKEWDLPVAVTPKVKGIVDETAENFVGVVSGM